MDFPIWSRRLGVRTKLRQVWANRNWRSALSYFSHVVSWIIILLIIACAVIGIESVWHPKTVVVTQIVQTPPLDYCDLSDPRCMARVKAEVCEPIDLRPAIINPPLPVAKPKIVSRPQIRRSIRRNRGEW